MSLLDCVRNGQAGKKCDIDGFCFIGENATMNANAQKRNLAYLNKKGVAGKNTGMAARSAIQKAMDGGHTLEEIGKAASRSADTISKIKSGDVSNPPAELVAAIRAMKAKPKG